MKLVDKINDLDIMNCLDWHNIVVSYDLSDSFIDKYADSIPFDYLIKYQKLSESFILKHAGHGYRKFSLYYIMHYQNFSKFTLRKILEATKGYW